MKTRNIWGGYIKNVHKVMKRRRRKKTITEQLLDFLRAHHMRPLLEACSHQLVLCPANTHLGTTDTACSQRRKSRHRLGAVDPTMEPSPTKRHLCMGSLCNVKQHSLSIGTF